jgi:hypothetical protein
MSENSRVKRWRDAKRQHGLKAVTIWLTGEEELRLKDLALQWHCSPSTVVQRALAQISTSSSPQHSSPADTLLIREIIRAELAAMQAEQARVTGGVIVGPTDAKRPEMPPAPTPAREYVAAPPGHSMRTESAPTRKGGRQRSELGQRVLALLQAHPEGLSAKAIAVYLDVKQPLGDMLQGMKRTGAVRAEGSGKALRYFAARL